MALLKEIADVQTGPFGSQLHKEDYVSVGTPIVTVEHLGNRVFTEQNLPMVSDEDKERLSKYVLREGDTVFSRVGSVDRCSYVDGKHEGWMFSGRCLRVRPNNTVDSEYLYYFFTTEDTKQLIRNIAVGATMPSINTKILSEVEVPLPDLDTQRKIASILSAIDEKIEVNNQINRNLSEMLAAMYKHDYLEEIANREDWIEVTMDDITSKFATGLNPRKNFVLGHGENYYVTIKNMNNNRVYLDSKCDMVDDEALVKINKRSDLQVGDLLFSGIGTIGRVHLIDEPPTNWNISESVFTMRPSEAVSSEFLYLLLLSYDMQDYAVSLASGSVQKGIRMADLKRYKLYLPSKEDMDKLTSAWKPLIDKIKKHEKENDELVILRDTVLPKLMSGELDLSELDIQLLR